MATINIVGELVNDQTAGIQNTATGDPDGDDVAVSVAGGLLVSANLDPAFVTYLNGLGLTAGQLAFADSAEAASQADLIHVTAGADEVVDSLIFAPLSHADSGLNTVGGEDIFLTTSADGKSVLATDTSGDPVAAFYIIPNSDNTLGTVQMVTFAPIAHPNDLNPDDRLDFSDILKVRALSHTDESIGGAINVDDDGPTISQATDNVNLVVDETTLGTNASDDFSTQFTKNGGTDGEASTIHTLSITGGNGTDSGLIDTASGGAVLLFNNGGVIEGRVGSSGGILVFTVTTTATGVVTLDQVEAVKHPDNTLLTGSDETVTLALDNLIVLTATITDNDGDKAAANLNIGQNLVFHDDIPSIHTTGTPPNVTVDETTLGTLAQGDYAPNFVSLGGADGSAGVIFSLGVTAGLIAGLTDSETGEGIDLQKVGAVVEGRTAIGGLLVFSVSVTAAGLVNFTQARSLTHTDATNPDDSRPLGAANLVTLTGTVTDGDGDARSAVLNIGDHLLIKDDGPTIVDQDPSTDGVQGFDGDPAIVGIQHETLHNIVNTPATGVFSFDIGADDHLPAFYTAGGSDFGDSDGNSANGVQRLTLIGTVDNAANPNITNIVTSLTSEDASSAVFAFSFHYDKDPITAGVQDATAGGTLTFDKAAGTYSIALNDVVDGFSFNVFHSSELTAKAPPGNTGHPELVVTQLDANPNTAADHDGFYVQFTANSNPNGSPFGFNGTGDGNPIAGDTTFNSGQFVTSAFEDWVSATQSTNGVAGDTIQKGELLTLRFFNENILGDVNPGAPGGGTEKIVPTDKVDAIAIKFDGIGNAESLIVVLDLIDDKGTASTADDIHTTRSIVVDNADFFKGNTVPSPYSTEFSLDNNDGLVIIEKGDYNNAALGENFSIQGMQIMQSSNGLTGSGINLTKATDNPNTVAVEGNSPVTGPLQSWGATDNDVLKITDIGFIQTTSGQIGAHLDFAVNIQDGDGDTTGIQHLLVDVVA
ncbi:hypothetical protein EJ076_29600 [Mesorhizobium sp. M7D.F.Ca.US.005.01.1.1]|uniref:DUF5801 repeats-in-toxin domain-containing protein n=1 Tax=Mesorhizobium sp. M7D.F.Ca.US.005.01.1.1 TaxID=2493678 RepID=UPI000F75EAD7|nr:DUF5801 repeats-in-toxin domain-containing protein [Mesorhizobium sp. M7D.F.Ca.US.005.01.1.1]AZO44962.1 hypothetical protein EJ076_29600 [Mesorhizobium sp. M7D.F.Ca.US.005.01.1.1]